MTNLWKGKSAVTALNIFQALQDANIDEPRVQKVTTSGSPDFVVLANVASDDDLEMFLSAKKIVDKVLSQA